jgi:hypothetical protein
MSTETKKIAINQPKDKEGKRQWLNPKGETVPAAYIRKINKQQDATAFKQSKKALALHNSLVAFKKEIMDECDALYEQMKADAHIKTSQKGSYAITSFGGEVKIEMTIQDRVAWKEPEIGFAKAKIFEYLKSELGDKQEAVRKLIYTAFETSGGKLDTKRILGLLKLEINDATWKAGIELLKQSMQVVDSKRYVRVFVRDAEGEYQPIDLNFSSL